jgi:hypothetical protein
LHAGGAATLIKSDAETEAEAGYAARMSDPTATAAIFKAVALTALVDGSSEPSEAEIVPALVALDPGFAALDHAFEAGVQARQLLEQLGVEDALHQLCEAIVEPGDQLRAFRLCARVMIADGKTEGDEAMVLGCLQEEFGLPNAEVVAILAEERQRKA